LNNEPKQGFLNNAKQRVTAQADALKDWVSTVLREKATEIRDVIGREKVERVKQPERPFGRDEGGEDVKRVVWTGHTVRTSEGHTYFGSAGLTQGGYYRAAVVQVYGSDELWRWQTERHHVKEDAISSAEKTIANQLRQETVPAPSNAEKWIEWAEISQKEKEQEMAELPEHVKAEAVQATTSMNKAEIQTAEAGRVVKDLADPFDTKAMEAQREQQRQNALDRKTPDVTLEPDKQ
jgi:hypothetical protein